MSSARKSPCRSLSRWTWMGMVDKPSSWSRAISSRLAMIIRSTRSGQSPPANTATRLSGSHRSLTLPMHPFGTDGRVLRTSSRIESAHAAMSAPRPSTSGSSTSQSDSSTSPSEAGNIVTTMDRCIVSSGRSGALPAIATGANVGRFFDSQPPSFDGTRVGRFPPILYPLLSTPNTSPIPGFPGLRAFSASSINSTDGCAARMRGISADDDTEDICTGFGTSRSKCSRTVVLPDPGIGEVRISRGVV